MRITIIDKTPTAAAVSVEIIKEDDLVRKTNIKEKIINWHYEHQDEAHNVSDLESEALEDYICEELGKYSKFAKKILKKIYDEIVAEINDLDDDAIACEKERKASFRGEY